MKWLSVRTDQRCCFVDLTRSVQAAVEDLGIGDGAVQVFVTHTTAGITINESADPAVPMDILGRLEALVPHSAGYRHSEGNSDAHIKTLLTGS
ncbi:MAG: secondary thiamine-phosphate synthase enzyme YjbQ, partial [Planctomycetes bacterium]|nr:secondary thiamine-phosphate synthase enzyme YjbQ [Planctomycetota bacterium]